MLRSFVASSCAFGRAASAATSHRALSATAAAKQSSVSRQEVEDLFREPTEEKSSSSSNNAKFSSKGGDASFGGSEKSPQLGFSYDRSKSLNKVELRGGVSRVSPYTTADGQAITYVDLVTWRFRPSTDGEPPVKLTELHSLRAHGKMAAWAQGNLARGTQIKVEGRITYSRGRPDENGKHHQRTYIVPLDMQVLRKPNRDAAAETA